MKSQKIFSRSYDPSDKLYKLPSEALSLELVAKVQASVLALHELVESLPSHTSWVNLAGISLQSIDEQSAKKELAKNLRAHGPDWFWSLGKGSNGGWVGYASDEFIARPFASRNEEIHELITFRLFDFHSQLSAWWLSHLWRAIDLTDVAVSSLASWHVLPAATCARSLMEGAVASIVQGNDLLKKWVAFKREGPPSLESTEVFRDEWMAILNRAQWGSRLGERSDMRKSPINQTSVLTLLEKCFKEDKERWEIYEWLCDAAHPSFGFRIAYTAIMGFHQAKSALRVDLARRPLEMQLQIGRHDPTIARNAANALVISVQDMLAQAPRLRWLIEDYGETTGVAYRSKVPYFGSRPEPHRNERCPCGSGKKYKKCNHQWGKHVEPPFPCPTD